MIEEGTIHFYHEPELKKENRPSSPRWKPSFDPKIG